MSSSANSEIKMPFWSIMGSPDNFLCGACASLLALCHCNSDEQILPLRPISTWICTTLRLPVNVTGPVQCLILSLWCSHDAYQQVSFSGSHAVFLPQLSPGHFSSVVSCCGYTIGLHSLFFFLSHGFSSNWHWLLGTRFVTLYWRTILVCRPGSNLDLFEIEPARYQINIIFHWDQ